MAYSYYQNLTIPVAAAPYLRERVKLTMSAAPSMTLLTLAPVTLTMATPVSVSLRDRLPIQTMQVEVAPSMSLTYTEPADTRESYTALIAPTDGRKAIRDIVKEVDKSMRPLERRVEEFGTVTYHTRVFSCPIGKPVQAALNSLLSLGAHMREKWSDQYYSLKLDGPKVFSVSKYSGKATALGMFTVTFAELHLPAPVVAGYNEMLRQFSKNVSGDTGVIWGVTKSKKATNMPAKGDRLDGYQGLDAYRCLTIEYFENRLPGRILVRTTWGRYRAASPILEFSSVTG